MNVGRRSQFEHVTEETEKRVKDDFFTIRCASLNSRMTNSKLDISSRPQLYSNLHKSVVQTAYQRQRASRVCPRS